MAWASSSLRLVRVFLRSSICFGVTVIVWVSSAVFCISFLSSSLRFGLMSLLSRTPIFLRWVRSLFSMSAPASIMGPMTGPRPASSMPSTSFVMCLC